MFLNINSSQRFFCLEKGVLQCNVCTLVSHWPSADCWGEDRLTSQKSLVVTASINLKQSSREICQVEEVSTTTCSQQRLGAPAGEVPIASATVHHLDFSDPLALIISSSHLFSASSEFGLISISEETCKRSISSINYSFLCCNGFQVCDTHNLLLHSLYSYLELLMI